MDQSRAPVLGVFGGKLLAFSAAGGQPRLHPGDEQVVREGLGAGGADDRLGCWISLAVTRRAPWRVRPWLGCGEFMPAPFWPKATVW